MTSKERAALRGQANTLEPLFQVGKSGATAAVAAQILEAFNTRELLKIKVLLESAPETPRETTEKLATDTGSEVVQVIGGSIILFKENPELHEDKKPKKKPAKKVKPRAKAKVKPGGLSATSRAADRRKAMHRTKVEDRRK